MDSEDPSAKRLDDATKNVRTGKGATPAAISKKDTKQVQSKAPVGKGKLVAGAKKKGTHDKKADSGDAFAEAARLAALKKEKEDKDNFDEALDGAVTGVIDEEEEDKAGEELDDGWESDLGDADNCLKKKATSDPYINACKVLGIVPVSYFAERINTSEILLKHRGLGPKGAQAIASVLESNTTITLLDLSDNWIESGGAHLGRSLQINRTLTYLNLTNNKLGLQGATEIAEMLSFNGTLKTLIMKGNSLGDKEASLLAEGLRQNSTLQVIDLSYNQIGDLGAHSLGSGLVTNDGIKELNLAWNQIRVRGANGFFNYLKDNAHISTLHIQDNGIGDNGLAVSTFLAKSNSISSLNISRTRMNDASMTLLSKGIDQNYSIKELDVSENPVGDVGILALFKSILSSNCIKRVVMKNIKITKEARVKLEELKTEKPEVEIAE